MEENKIISAIIKAQIIYKIGVASFRYLIALILLPFAIYFTIYAFIPDQNVFPEKHEEVIFAKDKANIIIAPETENIKEILIEKENAQNYKIDYGRSEARITPLINKNIGDILQLKIILSDDSIYEMDAVFRKSIIKQKINLLKKEIL